MELGLNNSLLAGDQRLIDHIVGEVKSQGIFDKFRKECLADVDTKPAYQNLRTRVESSVNSFLNKQTWKTDLNKNQLRETLRKHIHEAPYLEVGVERIVDQVVHPKVYSVFMPQVEDVVYKFLGIERPKSQRNGACDLKDLLPKDLDPVSPESDRNSLKDISLESMDENIAETVNGDEQEKSNSTNCQEKEQEAEEVLNKKETNDVENGENSQIVISSPIKTVLNCSFKSDETNKTEEEEEDSPVFEPIDGGILNESNMSNDSHLSGISELTSHRSRSPDFMTEFSRDNFDNSNQDSQLSKVSSNSRLSIVTDFGSSNHASTPAPESKEDSKYTKDNFKDVRESDSSKDKFNFEVIKSKESSKSISSKENSRDASEYKDSKSKEEIKSKSLKDKQDFRTNRDKDQNSRRRHGNKYFSNKSKDKNELESQEIKETSGKIRESKVKEPEKKDESSKEVKDLKDLYKEKIRELREKKELTEKEKLGKDKDCTKASKESRDKKDSSLCREKDDYKKNHKSSSSSSSRSSSYHNSKSSKSSESKESRDKSSSKRDDRHHSNVKSESRSSSKSKRDSRSESKSDNRSSDRSLKNKKRRDEKKSKSTDDHSSLRKNYNDRRSTDRDGSNGSSSKYSQKSPYSANNSSGKLGPTATLTKENSRDHHSSGETTDNIHDSLELMFADGDKSSANYNNNSNNSNNPPKRVDPGAAEICLPLKKRPLFNDDSSSEESKYESRKRLKVVDKKTAKRKIEKDIFKLDTDVASVPDEERVQIIEVPDEDYEQPYPDEEPILSLEETTKIILDAEPVHPIQSKLSEMEQSIRQSLNEMMGDHKLNETVDTMTSTKLTPVMDSNTLLETLTDDSNNDSEDLVIAENNQDNVQEKEDESLNVNADKVQKDVNVEQNEEKTDINMQRNEKIEEHVQKNIEMTDCKVRDEKQSDQSHETNVQQINSDIQGNKTETCNKEENTVNVNMAEDKEREREDPKDIDVKGSIIEEEKVSDKITEISIVLKPSLENVDQDEDSTDDNTDEFNEDHKLVIDEEFDDKESSNDNEINIISENESTNDMLTKSRIHYESNVKLDKEDFELDKDKGEESKNYDKCEELDVRNLKEDELKETLTDKSFDDDSMDDDDVKIIKIKEVQKPVEYTEDLQKHIKDRLIDELGKLNEEENDTEKLIDNEVLEIPVKERISHESLAQDECIEVDKDHDIEKLEEHSELIEVNESEQDITEKDNVKVNEEVSKDESIELSHGEDDDDEEDKSNELIICEEKEETEEELTLIINEDSSNEIKASTSSNKIEDDNKIDTTLEKEELQDSKDLMKDEKVDQPTTSKDTFNRSVAVVSPFEEDCLYLESQQSHQIYLKFKKFLEKLEANPNRSLEDMIESYGGVVVSAMPMAAPIAPPIPKRKLSTSPVGNIVATNTTTNNNIEGSVNDNSTEEVNDDAVSPMKKRKVGRTKKTSTSSSTSATNHQSQQHQLPPQQPQQQPHIVVVNGENFVMPLSPDSDVSATSDKNLANVLKDERSHRSGHSRSNQQRYSSDDLYKPRPLFSSTSRRNRRFNQA